MSQSSASKRAAVVCDPAASEVANVRAYVERLGLADAQWHAARDVDDVDRAVRAGRVSTVIFPDAASFLHAFWSQRIDVEEWLARGTHIRFAAGLSAGPDEFLDIVGRSWIAWRRRHRRRQAIAALILSFAALLAATVLLLLPYPGA